METFEYIPVYLFSRLARNLSFRMAGRVGGALASLLFALPHSRKIVTLDNLSKAFPDLAPRQIKRLARGAYRNYGTAMMEFFWSNGKTAEEILKTVQVSDDSAIRKYLGTPQALLFLSAHCGNWEWMLQAVRLYVGRPMTAVVHPLRNRRVDRLVESIRVQFGNSMIPMGSAVREVVYALHSGGYVCMLGDQSGPKEAVFIDFFGRPAATHRGAAAFSLRTGAPLILTLVERCPDGTYDLRFEDIDRTGLDKYTEENVVELTRRHTAALERYIRLRPDQWLWMHKRWKHTGYYESQVHTKEPA